jgi:hypothetical protein
MIRYLLLVFCGIMSFIVCGYHVEPTVFPEGYFDADTTTQVFVMGENHREKNNEHKLSLLFELYKNKGITKFGLEAPLAEEELYNKFLLSGDETIFELAKFDYKKIRNQEEVLLKEIRAFNLSNVGKPPITAFCFDVPRKNLYSTFLALKFIFQNNERVSELDLYKYLNEEKHYSNTEANAVLNKLSKDMIKNNDLYKSVLQQDFDMYQRVIEGLTISLDRFYMVEFSTWLMRENYIVENIREQLKNDEKIVIFCGDTHAVLKVNDKSRYGKEFSSFSSLLANKYSFNVFSIGLQYYKLKLGYIFGGRQNYKNYLSRPLNETISIKANYYFIGVNELKKHPKAAERYSMMLIKNAKWLK